MKRGLRTKINPVDDACNIDIDKDFSIEDQKLLYELNKIICLVNNGYLWRELSVFDLKLRDRLRKEN